MLWPHVARHLAAPRHLDADAVDQPREQHWLVLRRELVEAQRDELQRVLRERAVPGF